MPTQRQIVAMVDGRGFEQIEDPGFVSFVRRHPTDHRRQWLRVFWWSNPKHADSAGIPRAYLVVMPGLDHDIDHGAATRFRLPLVEWPDEKTERVPSTAQKSRPWKDIVSEFHTVFTVALDDSYDDGSAWLNALGDRYRLHQRQP
ncbi:MAG: hypothetical protein ACTH2X_00815 [Brachybacterium tyrofermentans]